MDFDALKRTAQSLIEPASWAYYQGTAGGDPEFDQQAWQLIDIVPRVLQGLTGVDQRVTIGGATLNTPVLIAATAGHGLADPEGEIATARAAATAGALMVYSSSATVEVTRFGATATGPWWAQVYLMRDRARSDDYLARCVQAGAQALVLTVDLSGGLAEAPFRAATQGVIPSLPGNFPGLTWPLMTAAIDANLRPDDIGEIARATGLPVYVKGVLHPDDAVAAVEAGAAGILVSNHGRRQVTGVVPSVVVLPDVVSAVGGEVPVMVDGGVRSGVDVLRGLALGATAVGIGRPVLWGLAAGGAQGVLDVVTQLTVELRQAMASVGAATLAALSPSMVRTAPPRRPGI